MRYRVTVVQKSPAGEELSYRAQFAQASREYEFADLDAALWAFGAELRAAVVTVGCDVSFQVLQ